MDTPPPIDTMSFDQLAAFMGSIEGHTAARYGGALTKRLYEIALYDNHIPQAHREGASELLRIIKQTMELAERTSYSVGSILFRFCAAKLRRCYSSGSLTTGGSSSPSSSSSSSSSSSPPSSSLVSRGGKDSPAAARRLPSANPLALSSVRRAVLSGPVLRFA